MKKFLRYFFIICIASFVFFTGIACKEVFLESISLSVRDATFSKGIYYVTKDNNKTYTIDALITPGDFTVNDFTWKSTNTEVARVNVNTFKAVGVGEATIIASYINSNGTEISDQIKINVSSESSDISFPSKNLTATYTGETLNRLFRVNEDDETGKFEYAYYSYSQKQMVSNIIDAGSYKIICTSVENPNIEETAELVVNKHRLSFTGSNYQIVYGDRLPDGIYNENSLPENILANSQIGVAVNGIGRESDLVIGKIINTTNAYIGADAGSYKTSVHFEINALYSNNYDLDVIVNSGNFNIIKKNVVLVPSNQELVYGNSISLNAFNLFSYDEYKKNNDFILDSNNVLVSDIVDFKSNIRLNAPKYLFVNEDEVKSNVQLNSVGLLNVLDENCYYELSYPNAITISSNIEIKESKSGKVTVTRKPVEICPIEGQSKIYTKQNPTTFLYKVTDGSFVSNDIINDFLYIDYGKNELELPIDPIYANVGDYYFKINEEANNNYEIKLNIDAVFVEEADNSKKIRFSVLPCAISVEFQSKNANYVKASSVKNGEEYHTVSYFNDESNYILELKSLKINSVEYVNNGVIDSSIKCENFEDSNLGGKFWVDPTNELFGCFSIIINPVKDGGYSYVISSGISYDSVTTENNFTFNSVNSSLTLNKIMLTVKPTENQTLVSKIFDGTQKINENFGFYASIAEPYFSLSDSSIDLINVFQVPGLILSLKNAEDKYILVDENGLETEVDTIQDVGKYKIFLADFSEKEYIPGMEYLEFRLDDSKEYYFSITPLNLEILPEQNQSKIYAGYDKYLKYSIVNLPETIKVDYESETNIPIEIAETEITGSLSRVKGEDIGEYKIEIGSLNFGKNFNISISEQPVYFKINKRNVKIQPIQYVTVYGDTYPSVIGFYQTIDTTDEIDESIKVAPKYTGQFSLSTLKDGVYTKANKIGNFYPVNLDENKEIVPYYITQGEFECSNNYQIEFIEGSTFTINKRPSVVNILNSQSVDSVLSTTIIDFSEAYYEVTNIIDGATYSLDLELKNNGSIYNVSSFNLHVYKNNIDIGYCYDITLGKDVVYNINVKMIYLSLVSAEDLKSSIVEKQYSGLSHTNQSVVHEYGIGTEDFYLVSQTETSNASEEYIISNETKFKLNFSLLGTEEIITSPKNVGSYNVSIDLSNGGQIVLLKKSKTSHVCTDDCNVVIGGDGQEYCTEKYLVFTELDSGLIIDNCALSIGSVGYLNITRADIIPESSKLGFTQNLIYGTNTLSPIKENSESEIIFSGLEGDEIKLVTYENGLNFKYNSSNYALSRYDANTVNNISVTIEAENKNYKPLTLNVPLHVDPKSISYTYIKVKSNRVDTNGIVYDGTPLDCNLELTLIEEDKNLSQYYECVYSHVRYLCEYDNSDSCNIVYYDYDKDTKTVKTDTRNLMKYSSLSFTPNSKSFEISYEGVQYIICDNKYAFIADTVNNKDNTNAGFYICFIVVQADDNHTFIDLTDEDNPVAMGSSFQIDRYYEIKKSSEVEISNWKNEFYYTTEFDFDNPSTLPFSYDVSISSLKDKVTYEMTEKPEKIQLDRNKYQVSLIIDTDNYYYNKTFDFEVIPLPAEIILPLVNTYVFTDSPITSFLVNIGAILKDKEGKIVNTIYYTGEDSGFKFSYFEFDEDTYKEIEEVPSNVGKYKIEIFYSDSSGNRSGKSEFYYNIIKKAFTGSIKFKNAEVVYDPILTPEQLYDLVLQKMFSIDLEESKYSITVLDYTDSTSSKQYYISRETNYQDFKKIYSVGQKVLNLKVSFKDDITAETTLSALLTISPSILKIEDFGLKENGSGYDYDGFYKYHEISYKDIELNPNNNIERTLGEYKYKVRGTLSNNSGGYPYVEITDNLDHLIFKITYKYKKYDYRSLNPTFTYKDLVGTPIVPNEIYTDLNGNSFDGYMVEYSIASGDNYSDKNINLGQSSFSINKTNLYISFAYDSVDFANKDYYQTYIPKDLVVKNTSSSSLTNMNYDICRNLSSFGSYSEEKGVYLLLNFFKDGERISEVKNCGNYTYYVSLYCKNDYVLSDYFNNIQINGLQAKAEKFSLYIENIETSSEYKLTSILGETFAHESFTVNQADAIYNIDNYSSAFSICDIYNNLVEPKKDAVNIDNENYNYLLLNENYKILIKDGITISIGRKTDNTTEILKDSIDSTCNLLTSEILWSELDLYCFIIKENNYSDSTIWFKIRKVPFTVLNSESQVVVPETNSITIDSQIYNYIIVDNSFKIEIKQKNGNDLIVKEDVTIDIEKKVSSGLELIASGLTSNLEFTDDVCVWDESSLYCFVIKETGYEDSRIWFKIIRSLETEVE